MCITAFQRQQKKKKKKKKGGTQKKQLRVFCIRLPKFDECHHCRLLPRSAKQNI